MLRRTFARWNACGRKGRAAFALAGAAVLAMAGAMATVPAARSQSTPPPAPAVAVAERLELVQQIGGRLNGLAVSGDRAFLSVGPRVVVLDISAPDRTKVIGQSEVLPGIISDLVMIGDRVYVLTGGGRAEASTLQAIDVADPARPHSVGSLGTYGKGWRMTVHDGRVVIVNLFGTLSFVDVGDPGALRSTDPITDLGSIRNALFVDDVAYIAEAKTNVSIQLRTVDVNDPGAERAVVDLTDGSQQFYAAMARVDDLLAVFLSSSQGNRLTVLDIADRRHPKVLGTTAEGLGKLTSDHIIPKIAIRGRRVYIRGDPVNAVVHVVDIQDPSTPRLAAVVNLDGEMGRRMGALAIAGDRLLWAGSALQQLELPASDRDPSAQPRLVGRWSTVAEPWQVAGAGETAYVADRFHGIWAIGNAGGEAGTAQVTARLTPKIVTPFVSTHRVAVDGGRLFAMSGGITRTLHVVDIRDPLVPVEVGSLPFGTTNAIAAAGGRLYGLTPGSPATGSTAAVSPTLRVYETAGSGLPVLAGQLDLPRGGETALAVGGSYAAVGGSTSALQIVDIRDPRKPALVGEYAPGYKAHNLAIVGSRVYMMTEVDPQKPVELLVLDIADPAVPRLLGSLPMDFPGLSYRVAALGHDRVIIELDRTMRAIDVRDPANMRVTAQWNLASINTGLDVVGDRAWVSTRDGGVFGLALRREVVGRVYLPWAETTRRE